MRTFLSWWLIGLWVALIALMLYAGKDANRKQQECNRKGGAWLYREQVCLKGEQIPIE